MRPTSILLPLCLLAISLVAAERIDITVVTNVVPVYGKAEFVIIAPSYSDPFDPAVVDLRIEVTGPDGKMTRVPAFFYQPYERRRAGEQGLQRDWCYSTGLPGWRARFAPASAGNYRVHAVLKDDSGERRSGEVVFACVPSQAKGFIRVARKDPRFLEFDCGESFFPIAQNLAFIGNQQYVSLTKAEQIFQKLADNGANYLRVWTCSGDWALAIEARKSAWGRSWSGKDRFVPAPDDPSRKCVLMQPDREGERPREPLLEVNPSHPVALRPGTKYLFAASLWADTNVSSFAADVHGQTVTLMTERANIGKWTQLRHEFTTAPRDYWLSPIRIRVQGGGQVWLRSVSLQEAAGGPELLWEADMNRKARGFYNPLDCFQLDELLAAAEERGIYLQLCMLTRDLYMTAVQNTSSAEYNRAIADAKNCFRYAIARWGYSTSVGAWEYWNEMNPGLPTERFYTEVGEFFEQADPYHHLRTTSTWGPSAKDCRHPKLDMADVHFYLRPADKGRLTDEVDAVLERTRWLREQAPNKPAHLGEFGLADDQWRVTRDMQRISDISDVHNALWASALSGSTGTAMFWWWERIDQRNGYAFYKPLSRFVADVPWNGGEVKLLEAKSSEPGVRVIGVRAGDRAWLWLFDPAAAWAKVAVEQETPPARKGLKMHLSGFADGQRVTWSDTRTGDVVGTTVVKSGTAEVPSFRGDIAAKVLAR